MSHFMTQHWVRDESGPINLQILNPFNIWFIVLKSFHFSCIRKYIICLKRLFLVMSSGYTDRVKRHYVLPKKKSNVYDTCANCMSYFHLNINIWSSYNLIQLMFQVNRVPSLLTQSLLDLFIIGDFRVWVGWRTRIIRSMNTPLKHLRLFLQIDT